MTPKEFSDLLRWLTPDRLSRLNHLRSRANAKPLNRDQMALKLSRMSQDDRRACLERAG